MKRKLLQTTTQIRSLQQQQQLVKIGRPVSHQTMDLLKTKELRRDDRKYFGLLATNLERAKSLVQQILVFSRGGRVEKSLLNVVPIANDVVRMIIETFPKSIDLAVKFGLDTGSVFADSTLKPAAAEQLVRAWRSWHTSETSPGTAK